MDERRQLGGWNYATIRVHRWRLVLGIPGGWSWTQDHGEGSCETNGLGVNIISFSPIDPH